MSTGEGGSAVDELQEYFCRGCRQLADKGGTPPRKSSWELLSLSGVEYGNSCWIDPEDGRGGYVTSVLRRLDRVRPLTFLSFLSGSYGTVSYRLSCAEGDGGGGGTKKDASSDLP